VQRFLQTAYPNALLSTPGKITVVCATLAIFGLSLYGAPQVKADYKNK
jgi:hypothetical protein